MLFRVMKAWIPLAVVATCACGLAYVGVQQAHRSLANDPQIQLAQDGAALLASGAPAGAVAGYISVDVTKSLAPWVVVFDAQGRPIVGSGRLDGAPATPPRGVFAAAVASGEDVVTWQPRPGVRSAIAVVPVKGGRGGWVVAGRSLRAAEARVDQLTALAGAAWLAALLGSLVAVVAFDWAAQRRVEAADRP